VISFYKSARGLMSRYIRNRLTKPEQLTALIAKVISLTPKRRETASWCLNATSNKKTASLPQITQQGSATL
jgi:cytoplasmic iron level regulating protein YaaA (DUF328/UPF0246 family)